ncbi:MAG: SH3 domain-containing protein [Lachnospiraceae bacterium]|nr:SH3 domain-containing protein [Lachnospiraceae bacterium]
MRTRFSVIALCLFLWIAAGCVAGNALPTEPSASKPAATKGEPTAAILPTEPSAAGPGTGSETDHPTEEETEPKAEPYGVFFGKRMNPEIAVINEKTLATEGAHLYSVLDTESIDALTVSNMILRYEVPSGGYLGSNPISDVSVRALEYMRNLKELESRSYSPLSSALMIPVRYGILVTNADVRSFPTSLRYTKTGSTSDHDLFQETKLSFATGVAVLHTSSDGTYSFCLGENYAGWIRTDEIAFTDHETMKAYLSPEAFVVSFGQDPGKDWNRLGLVLPLVRKTESAFVVSLPGRNAEGYLECYEAELDRNSGAYREGFLEYDPEKAAEIAKGLLETPYGWGDEGNYYDCSSFAGAVMRCFGYYLPRNSSDMHCFGGTVISTERMTGQERALALSSHDFSVLVMPGHVMLCHKTRNERGETLLEIIQEGTGWYGPSGVRITTNAVTLSDLNEMLSGDGTPFAARVHTILVFE